MRVLLITDIHGDVETLSKILDKEEYDAVLCAGDLSDANEFLGGEPLTHKPSRIVRAADRLPLSGRVDESGPIKPGDSLGVRRSITFGFGPVAIKYISDADLGLP